MDDVRTRLISIFKDKLWVRITMEDEVEGTTWSMAQSTPEELAAFVLEALPEIVHAHRYRNAWLSARRGRKRWYELYLASLDFPSRLNGMSFLRAAHRNACAVRQLSLEKAELEAELADLRLAISERQGVEAGNAPSE